MDTSTTIDPTIMTRESVARQLIAKHEKSLSVIRGEFEKYSKLEGELDSAAIKYKTERDTLNSKVQSLKDERQKYYTESQTLRQEFRLHAKKKKSMVDIPMEVLILTKQIDQFEWEIQTEAVNIEDEKSLVKNIRNNLQRLHEYADKYHELEELSKAVRSLASKLNKKLQQAEKCHDEMLIAVKLSDGHHKTFVDSIVKLRDIRGKRIGFQRDRDKHENALKHWKNIAEKEARKNKRAKAKIKPDALAPSTVETNQRSDAKPADNTNTGADKL